MIRIEIDDGLILSMLLHLLHHHADDKALFEESESKMAEITEAIRATAGKLGLTDEFQENRISFNPPSIQ